MRILKAANKIYIGLWSLVVGHNPGQVRVDFVN